MTDESVLCVRKGIELSKTRSGHGKRQKITHLWVCNKRNNFILLRFNARISNLLILLALLKTFVRHSFEFPSFMNLLPSNAALIRFVISFRFRPLTLFDGGVCWVDIDRRRCCDRHSERNELQLDDRLRIAELAVRRWQQKDRRQTPTAFPRLAPCLFSPLLLQLVARRTGWLVVCLPLQWSDKNKTKIKFMSRLFLHLHVRMQSEPERSIGVKFGIRRRYACKRRANTYELTCLTAVII